jgi:endonuclease-3
MRTQLGVHQKLAIKRRRFGRSFPARAHAIKFTPIALRAKGILHVAKRLTKAKAEELYARLAQVRPNPRTELEYANPYTLLVAVVLSAQATDKGVNRATGPLFALADTPAKMLRLGEAGVAQHIKTIGLWRNKARNVIALSRALIDRHKGEVPHEREALEALPGVGRKTANVVLMEVFGEATIAVDTHVFRVANRTGLADAKTPVEVESQLMRITPPRYLHGAHHWLILHGRYTCLARKPECPRCVIADICLYQPKTRAIASTKSPAPSGVKSKKR